MVQFILSYLVCSYFNSILIKVFSIKYQDTLQCTLWMMQNLTFYRHSPDLDITPEEGRTKRSNRFCSSFCIPMVPTPLLGHIFECKGCLIKNVILCCLRPNISMTIYSTIKFKTTIQKPFLFFTFMAQYSRMTTLEQQPSFECLYWLVDSWSSRLTLPALSTEFNWIVKMYSARLGVPVHWLYTNICSQLKHILHSRIVLSLNILLQKWQNILHILCWYFQRCKMFAEHFTARYGTFCYNLFVSWGTHPPHHAQRKMFQIFIPLFLFQNRIQMYTLKLHWI